MADYHKLPKDSDMSDDTHSLLEKCTFQYLVLGLAPGSLSALQEAVSQSSGNVETCAAVAVVQGFGILGLRRTP